MSNTGMLLIAIALLICAVFAEEGVFKYKLEHTLDNGLTWTDRSSVQLSFSATGSRIGAVAFTDFPLTPELFSTLQTLAQHDGTYGIRVSSAQLATPIASFAPACSLLESQFKEFLTFHTDVYGNILSLDYQAASTDCITDPSFLSSFKLPTGKDLSARPKGRVLVGKPGEGPKDVRSKAAAQAAKVNADGTAKPEEKSFFQKYWMYMLVGGIFMLLSGGKEPDAAPTAAAGKAK